MTTLAIELPDSVVDELEQRRTDGEALDALVQNAIEQWLLWSGHRNNKSSISSTRELTAQDLWTLWDSIQEENPIELEIPPRTDRSNLLLGRDYELPL